MAPIPGGFAGTTRAADRGEAGKIGLPGGKVDLGESPVQAALRESAEEGWAVSGIEPEPFYTAMVEGHLVAWFRAESAAPLESFKEQGRISPIVATLDEIASSGYGNDGAMAAWCPGV